MAMLAVANEIFLVVTPEVGSIRNSSHFVELAREIGLAGIVRVIVNRANHGIRVDDPSASLDMPIAATVMSNGPRAVVAANQGRPIITMFPREKIADDLHRVARSSRSPRTPPTPRRCVATGGRVCGRAHRRPEPRLRSTCHDSGPCRPMTTSAAHAAPSPN